MGNLDITLMKQIRATADHVRATWDSADDLEKHCRELRQKCIVLKHDFLSNLCAYVERFARRDESGWYDAMGRPDLTEARDQLERFGAAEVLHCSGRPTLFRFSAFHL